MTTGVDVERLRNRHHTHASDEEMSTRRNNDLADPETNPTAMYDSESDLRTVAGGKCVEHARKVCDQFSDYQF